MPPPLPPGHHAPNTTWRLGPCEYRAGDVIGQRRVGGEFGAETAQPGALFVVLRYVETNRSRETLTVSDTNVVLRDGQGRTFRVSSRGLTALAMATGGDLLVSELQPGVPHPGLAVFEVPDDVLDGPLDFVFTERGVLGTATAVVRVVPHARATARFGGAPDGG